MMSALEAYMNDFALATVVIGAVALVASLSAAPYFLLPQSVWDCAARHGRFAGLGIRGSPHNFTSGTRNMRFEAGLAGQSGAAGDASRG
jgi:hypothetical protein